ncbi:cytoplasmic protein [Arthrobacter crystallopoietes BAB-32]|uniref:Cytoplasmic protein n=1 Tax=Arthrobacter crystallopoietes BAB-32 TaxID=1246476 RepID=N1VAR6_9MICC|nr:cytoplasmic protein [Arthrobacter crystallopoietes BAB-32]
MGDCSDAVWRHLRTTASHTIGLSYLTELLNVAPVRASVDDYAELVIEDNVLGRATESGRRRVYRHLREVYSLDVGCLPFRAMRDLWGEDSQSRPLLAGLLAFSRDEFLRASFSAVRDCNSGELVTPGDLAHAVGMVFPQVLSPATLAKVGRNTASSWQQIGHLSGKSGKVRTRAQIRPAATAYALFLGHLSGVRGTLLLNTPWTALLDTSVEHVRFMAEDASRLGYLELRSAGGVDELEFSHLMRGDEGRDR